MVQKADDAQGSEEIEKKKGGAGFARAALFDIVMEHWRLVKWYNCGLQNRCRRSDSSISRIWRNKMH